MLVHALEPCELRWVICECLFKDRLIDLNYKTRVVFATNQCRRMPAPNAQSRDLTKYCQFPCFYVTHLNASHEHCQASRNQNLDRVFHWIFFVDHDIPWCKGLFLETV